MHTLHGPWVPEVEVFHRSNEDALHWVAISEDQRSRAPGGGEVEHMVQNGISLTEHPFRACTDDDRYLAFVGWLNTEKGPEVAVRVAKRLGMPLKMAIKINEPPEQVY